jgi:hypothetical protein
LAQVKIFDILLKFLIFQAKKMGIEPNDHIYSALFNACANSPWPEDGLRRAKLLLEDIAVKDISLNSVTYNTIVKAFAFCGDARTNKVRFGFLHPKLAQVKIWL